jgi:broad specificity phosphatase PhoE
MGPTFFIRHGQSCSNAAKERKVRTKFINSALTTRGTQQARELCRYFRLIVPVKHQPRVVIASILLRSIQTALLAFPDADVWVVPAVREYVFNSASQPQEVEVLQKRLQNLLTPAQIGRLRWELADPLVVRRISQPKENIKANLAMLFQGSKNLRNVVEHVRGLTGAFAMAVVSHGAFLKTSLEGRPNFHNTAVWYEDRFVYAPLEVKAREDELEACIVREREEQVFY